MPRLVRHTQLKNTCMNRWMLFVSQKRQVRDRVLQVLESHKFRQSSRHDLPVTSRFYTPASRISSDGTSGLNVREFHLALKYGMRWRRRVFGINNRLIRSHHTHSTCARRVQPRRVFVNPKLHGSPNYSVDLGTRLQISDPSTVPPHSTPMQPSPRPTHDIPSEITHLNYILLNSQKDEPLVRHCRLRMLLLSQTPRIDWGPAELNEFVVCEVRVNEFTKRCEWLQLQVNLLMCKHGG